MEPGYLVQVELNLLPELRACTSMSAPAEQPTAEQILWYLAVRNPYGKRFFLVQLMVSLLLLERSNVCLQAKKRSVRHARSFQPRARVHLSA